MNARDLTARLAELLRREHGAMADFLSALAAFDQRRAWLELGHPSLFSFLHRELGLSKGAAYQRLVAARLVGRHPELEPALRDGRLCITSVVELSRVLTPENLPDVLPRFFHRSKQEARIVAAELCPREAAPRRELVTAVAPGRPAVHPGEPVRLDGPESMDRRDSVRLGEPVSMGHRRSVHLDEPEPAASPPARPAEPRPTTEAVHPDEPLPRTPPPPPRPEIDPLTADLRRLHLTVSRRFLEKLDAARAALSHQNPGAGAGEILEAGLDLLLAAHARRKALVARPRAAQAPVGDAAHPAPATPSDDGAGSTVAPAASLEKPFPASGARRRPAIPAAVRREVWLRDGGCCQWPLASGGVCASTLRLELDHVVPWSRGGPSTVANLRLLCSFHNGVAARRALGDAVMDLFTHREMQGGERQGAA